MKIASNGSRTDCSSWMCSAFTGTTKSPIVPERRSPFAFMASTCSGHWSMSDITPRLGEQAADHRSDRPRAQDPDALDHVDVLRGSFVNPATVCRDVPGIKRHALMSGTVHT